MNAETIPLWLALFIQIGLGLAVFRANYRSYSNQSFLIVSLIVSAWLLSLLFAFNAANVLDAEFWIRTASATGILIVNGFNLLRLAIVCRETGWKDIGKRSAILAGASAVMIGLCYTSFFLRYAELRREEAPPHEMVPQPVYGPLFPAYVAFLAASILIVILLYVRGIRKTTGMQKVELQFVVTAQVALAVVTFATTALLPFLSRAALVRLAPFRIVIFSMIIAYGIATRKLMDVGTFVRRFVSYVLLASYLAAIYFGVWWIGDYFLHGSPQTSFISHLLATVAVALSMTPARGVSKNFADKLFVNSSGLDFRATVSKAATILSSVTTLTDLLDRFAATVAEAVGTDRVIILLHSQRQFIEAAAKGNSSMSLSAENALVQYLQATRGSAVRDELYRVNQTEEVAAVLEELDALDVAAAMGIFSREHLSAVMLLGTRLSGRIYGSVEQNALQVLCGQLAVAIENAELFTEVQNAKIYNETLLANLTTGVIAAGADERITVFNNEAAQITGLSRDSMLGRSAAELPAGLRDILRQTLTTRERQEQGELSIRAGDRSVIVRASSSIFRGQQQQILGALIVLTDITALKRLEQQIRRSDRLASLGTLSAGMAHEIKNPLVSIKTFAQLLPERYNDSDFRTTFSNLIGHEIDRIDGLVNQLLRFARPAKPLLKPMHVHDVLEKSLQLIGHRLYQKEIKLSRFWRADVDTIRADADQLEQVFLNFFLNAMDAMPPGGELNVSTEILRPEGWLDNVNTPEPGAAPEEILRITIRDNGAGISADDIPHVFDPFFTTKDYGTGLGLSVVHGIVEEHGGHIDVESELTKGTAFHILLPLVRFQQEVAVA